MKTSALICISVLVASSAFGQYRGGNTYGSFSGFGSVAFPGTGHPPAPGNFSITDTGFARSLGSVVGGVQPYRYNRRSIGSYPYAYPVYVGGYSGYGYDAGLVQPQNQPNITIVNQPSLAAPAPQVVINQNFGASASDSVMAEPARDTVHVFDSPSRVSIDSSSNLQGKTYLIPYKDHSVYSALAYWVDNSTLHYVTAQNVHNQASLDLIDVAYMTQLNKK